MTKLYLVKFPLRKFHNSIYIILVRRSSMATLQFFRRGERHQESNKSIEKISIKTFAKSSVSFGRDNTDSIRDSATTGRNNRINRKLTRVVFSVIAAFILCWAPNQILNLIYLLNPVYATKHYFIIFTKVTFYISTNFRFGSSHWDV